MPENALVLTPETVKRLVNGRYLNGAKCIGLAKKLRVHAYGEVPEKLINERRPNEPESIKAYRAQIYVPITKKSMSKVFSSLQKIRRSQDWSIQFDADSVKSTIAANETLQRYLEEDYPVHTSLTNWAFAELLKKYLLDANGIIAVVPESIPENSAEYIKPVAMFFDSDQIVDYSDGKYAVLRSRDQSEYLDSDGVTKHMNGAIFYVITPYQIARYEQTSVAGDVRATQIYNHNIGSLPAFKAGGMFLSRENNDTIYESRIAGMVPSLDEAAREYSDLQAEILQHIHSEKYAYANAECPHCKGLGKIKNEETGKFEPCPHCNGSGSVLAVSPYGIHIINPTKAGENGVPTPPIGYIAKSVEIAKLQDDRVRQHIYDALAAINMEFLAETPLAQSGIAKAVDRDELNNFVDSIAEDIVRILDDVAYYICEYRYMLVVPNPEDRRAMLPKINVPTKYDIVNTGALMAELAAAKTANANPTVLRELEIDYAKKQFCTNPDVAAMAECTFDLDPLFGINTNDKMAMLEAGGITKTDYIISCNVQSFVRRAVNANAQFYTLTYEQKMEKMREFAAEVEKANEPAQQVLAAPNFEA